MARTYIPTGRPRGRPPGSRNKPGSRRRGPDISFGKRSPDFVPRGQIDDVTPTPEAWDAANEVSPREVAQLVGFDRGIDE